MEYLYIFLAVLGISGTFVGSKIYQTKFVSGKADLLLYSLWFAIGGGVFAFLINKAQIHYSSFTLWTSFLYAAVVTFYNVVGLIVLKYCRLSLYTTFMMAGGMVVPSIVGGIFLDERTGVFRILGILVVLAALLVPTFRKDADETKLTKTGLLLCVSVFFANGAASSISKLHQINPSALGTYDFLIWVYLWMAILSALVFLAYYVWNKRTAKKTDEGEMKKASKGRLLLSIALVVLIAIVSCTGSVFNLMGAKTVDASMLYPMITGGSMVLTALFGWLFFKEKWTKSGVISLILAVVGTVLFVF